VCAAQKIQRARARTHTHTHTRVILIYMYYIYRRTLPCARHRRYQRRARANAHIHAYTHTHTHTHTHTYTRTNTIQRLLLSTRRLVSRPTQPSKRVCEASRAGKRQWRFRKLYIKYIKPTYITLISLLSFKHYTLSAKLCIMCTWIFCEREGERKIKERAHV